MLPAARVIAGRYRVLEVIGEGAQSVVYRAEKVGDGEVVALKVIHRHLSGNPQVVKRFHREAKILRGLAGEHIVRLLDFFEEDGLLMIALEHVTGESLDAVLTESRTVELEVAIEIALQVCAALGVAHANGVIHRDLKPANILIERPEGSSGALSARGIRVKVVDFGLGKVLHGELTSTGLTEQGMIFGTPEYMAPEQARGEELDARADLYALGIILYEMTVGEVPFQGRTAVSTMTAHLAEPVPSPRKKRPDARLSPALEAVIVRALSKDPASRYASAREMAEALATARDEPLVIAPSGVVSLADAAEMAQSDTDLHLEEQALGQAKTLRADEVAALAEAEQRSGRSVIVRPTEVPPTRPSPELPPNLDDAATAITEPPARTAYVWVVVAVVAALVGVAIGVTVGMR
jgi:serine/threonine-protein kinase